MMKLTGDTRFFQNHIVSIPNDNPQEVFIGFPGADVNGWTRWAQRGRKQVDPESKSSLLDSWLKVVVQFPGFYVFGNERNGIEQMQSQTIANVAKVGRSRGVSGLVIGDTAEMNMIDMSIACTQCNLALAPSMGFETI